MKFWNSNHIFRMGSSHKVCEDYAASSGSTLHPNSCHAVLGDGCSLCLDADNKPIEAQTDFGSRLLVRASQNIFHDFNRMGGDFEFGSQASLRRTIEKSWLWCNDLGFNRNTLSSTLLFARALNNTLRWHLCGDGVYAFRIRTTGVWEIGEIRYTSGMPYYLRYELNQADKTRFADANFIRCIVDKYTLQPDSTISWNSPMDRFWQTDLVWSINGHVLTEYIDMVCLFSDGISSFVRKDPNTGSPSAVPMIEAIKPFLAIKHVKGEFIERRAKAALRTYAEQGITHTDDFSMVGIYVE